jgi:hypothetical protein
LLNWDGELKRLPPTVVPLELTAMPTAAILLKRKHAPLKRWCELQTYLAMKGKSLALVAGLQHRQPRGVQRIHVLSLSWR